jgi:glycosyltransferase involved in cell wall biosynthesis
MAAVDWVVVPSIWWENSPMVIQEAMVHGRPLLVSDIGGMREKVKEGVTGFRVAARSALAWTTSLKTASNMTSEWDSLRMNTHRPIEHTACARAHLALLHQNRANRHERVSA